MYKKGRFSDGLVSQEQDRVSVNASENHYKRKKHPKVTVEYWDNLQVRGGVSTKLPGLLGLNYQEPH